VGPEGWRASVKRAAGLRRYQAFSAQSLHPKFLETFAGGPVEKLGLDMGLDFDKKALRWAVKVTISRKEVGL